MASLPYPRLRHNPPTDSTDFHRWNLYKELPQNSRNTQKFRCIYCSVSMAGMPYHPIHLCKSVKSVGVFSISTSVKSVGVFLYKYFREFRGICGSFLYKYFREFCEFCGSFLYKYFREFCEFCGSFLYKYFREFREICGSFQFPLFCGSVRT